MRYKPYVLIEWEMLREHYEVEWPVVRKKLGDPLTDWLLALPAHHGQVYIYHKPDLKLAQLVVEFFDSVIERQYLTRIDNPLR